MVLLTPKIGQWYVNRSGAAFEIVAIDDDSNAIDIQFVDGTVDELDDELWVRTVVEEIEPPNECISSHNESSATNVGESDFEPRNEWLDSLDFMDLEYVDLDDITEQL